MRGWQSAGNALIRSVLGLDPDTLCDKEWCYQVKMAVWAENRQAEYTGRTLAAHLSNVLREILGG